MNADHHDDLASKKTLLGVGLSSLLPPPAMPPVHEHEPTVLVSVDLDVAPRPIVKSRTTEKIARPAVLPTLPSSRRWKLVAIAGVAVAGSIVLGLGARSLMTADAEPVAQPVETVAEAVTPPTSPPVGEPEVAEVVPATAPARVAQPRVVDFGDGSCAAVIDAKLGGDVTLDEQSIGATPVTVEGLWCGRGVTVRIHRKGYETWTKTLVPQEGRTSRIAAALRRPPPPRPAVPESLPTISTSVEPSMLDKIRHAVFPRS